MPQMNIGFEIELILDDLGRPEFSLDEIYEPMDIASEEYCQAVAEILSKETGHHWKTSSAPWGGDEQPRDPAGFYVIPEYDLDPIDFVDGQIAGVEIITPPLPLEVADELRQQIMSAVYLHVLDMEFDPQSNFKSGWHINIDIDGCMPDPVRWAAMVDEYAIIAGTGREGRRDCGAAARSVYLTAIDAALSGDRLEINQEYLSNLMQDRAKLGKCFAANFSRGTYLELRHLGAECFLRGDSLEVLLEPILSVDFTSDAAFDLAMKRLQSRADILAQHAVLNKDRIEITEVRDRRKYSDNERYICVDGAVSASTWKEIKTLRSFTDGTPTTYGERDITIVPGTNMRETLSIHEVEGGSPVARIFLLAYEAYLHQQYAAHRAPVFQAPELVSLGEEIAQAMMAEGVSPKKGSGAEADMPRMET